MLGQLATDMSAARMSEKVLQPTATAMVRSTLDFCECPPYRLRPTDKDFRKYYTIL